MQKRYLKGVSQCREVTWSCWVLEVISPWPYRSYPSPPVSPPQCTETESEGNTTCCWNATHSTFCAHMLLLLLALPWWGRGQQSFWWLFSSPGSWHWRPLSSWWIQTINNVLDYKGHAVQKKRKRGTDAGINKKMRYDDVSKTTKWTLKKIKKKHENTEDVSCILMMQLVDLVEFNYFFSTDKYPLTWAFYL